MPIKIPDANNLPIAKHRRRHKKPINRPMTQEERDALQFEAIKAEFDWSNDEWAATWLPWVRLAAIHVAGDQDKLKELMADFVKDGEAGNILEGLTRTRNAPRDIAQARGRRTRPIIYCVGASGLLAG
ncbi:hypothetical protein ABIA06_005971 [Bradyrhizobium yuanmingense]|uniref:hypothetical protein n=1 Tax=Bradyrhizobium yuanmingense TaxID=108015 RepID=UPI00351614EE